MKHLPITYYYLVAVFVGTFYIADTHETASIADVIVECSNSYGVMMGTISNNVQLGFYLSLPDSIAHITIKRGHTVDVIVRSDKEVPYGLYAEDL